MWYSSCEPDFYFMSKPTSTKLNDAKTPLNKQVALKFSTEDIVDNPTLKEIFKNGSGKTAKIKPWKGWLWVYDFQTSASMTAQAPVLRCRPSDSAEFSSLASLYDEYKVLKIQWRETVTAPLNATMVDWATTYDPDNSGAYASLVGVLPSQYSTGPMACVPTGAGGGTALSAGGYVVSATKTGYHVTNVKVPLGARTNNSAATTCVTGMWVDVNQTVADFGWVKSYVNQPQTGTTNRVMYLGMYTEFRVRS